MSYSVEYRISNENTSDSIKVLFNTVDEALSFVNKIRDSFKNCLEYAFIHCLFEV